MYMKICKRCCLLVILLLLVGCMNKEEVMTIEEAAQEVITLLQNEEYQKVSESWFAEELQNSISVDDLAGDWEERTAGDEFIATRSFQTENRTESLDIVEATLEYTTTQFDVRMIFNQDRRLVGFHLSEGMMNVELPDSILEEEITVGEGTKYELEGLLTLPVEMDDTVPAVVLVHGSGPSDRDEAVFAYKPFRDIAWGLTEQGIAVIRYDKRTFTHADELIKDFGNRLTVFEETVEDAIRAAELAKADPRIDEERVFIVGHSLGGMLAPRIDVEGGGYAGLVILAGTPRPSWEVAYDQNRAAIQSQIKEEDEKEKQMKLAEEEYEKAKSLEEIGDEAAQDMTVFGMNGYYLKDMDKFNTRAWIDEMEKPILILQGEDDFQVYYDKDFTLWQELLSGKEQATLISYPGLNHSFVAYEGPHKGTLAEYKVPGQVDDKVIQDIGEWILKQEK